MRMMKSSNCSASEIGPSGGALSLSLDTAISTGMPSVRHK